MQFFISRQSQKYTHNICEIKYKSKHKSPFYIPIIMVKLLWATKNESNRVHFGLGYSPQLHWILFTWKKSESACGSGGCIHSHETFSAAGIFGSKKSGLPRQELLIIRCYEQQENSKRSYRGGCEEQPKGDRFIHESFKDPTGLRIAVPNDLKVLIEQSIGYEDENLHKVICLSTGNSLQLTAWKKV